MSKVLISKEKLDTLSETIKIKSNKTNNLTIDEMSDAVLNITSGDSSINGLIKNYKVHAGENISAGDFVEFAHAVSDILQEKNLRTLSNGVLIGNNKVFVVGQYYDGTSYYLYGTIVEINGTTMTATGSILHSVDNTSFYCASCILLENGKVFIPYSCGSNKYLYGTIVEINGTTMTATNATLNETANICYNNYPTCVLLENNKVFIAHSSSSSRYLYGTIVEINGTTMTATYTTQISTTSHLAYYPGQIIKLASNRVFIPASNGSGSNKYLYGIIVTINGGTMACSTKSLGIVSYDFITPRCVLLENNKIFVAYSNSTTSGTGELHGIIVVVDGTTMTPTSQRLNMHSGSTKGSPCCVLLENNKVLIAHAYGVFYRLYGTMVEINGTTMTAKTVPLNETDNTANNIPDIILLENNKAFIVHNHRSTGYLYGTIFETDKPFVKKYQKNIDGVANTSGGEGENLLVYVPNVQ
jgi:hypothetical protein